MTTNNNNELLSNAYDAFNRRDIDEVLATMDENVHWPNGWEGGYVHGYDGVRDYWTRQWAALNPKVVPVSFKEMEDGRIETLVQQTVKDLQDNIVFDGTVKHIYTISNGLITQMEIVEV